MPTPPIGLRHVKTLTVSDALTVRGLSGLFANFSEMPPVFATVCMIGLVESACVDALAPWLGPDQRSVGTRVDMTHGAATPVGMTVSAEVELVAARRHWLRFRVVARDARDEIGAGFHERALVDAPSFLARVRAKAGPD